MHAPNSGQDAKHTIPGPTYRIEDAFGDWELSSDVEEEEPMRFPTLESALHRGHELASARDGALYVFVDGQLSDKYVYFDAMGISAPVYHCAPDDDGWMLNHVSSESSHHERFDTKKSALARGRTIAREKNAVLVVYSKDGELLREHDYRAN